MMSALQGFRYATAWVACFGMLASPTVGLGDTLQPGPTAGAAVVRDVALAPNGALTGHVMDAQGQGVAQVVVIARSNGAELNRATTDAQGSFQLTAVPAGVVELTTPSSYGVFRVWQNHAAPPAAAQAAMLVPQQVVRGQQMDPYAGAACDPYGGQMSGPACAPCGPCPPACPPDPCGSCCGFLANPWVIGGVIAAAIAIPLALSDDDDDDAS